MAEVVTDGEDEREDFLGTGEAIGDLENGKNKSTEPSGGGARSGGLYESTDGAWGSFASGLWSFLYGTRSRIYLSQMMELCVGMEMVSERFCSFASDDDGLRSNHVIKWRNRLCVS